MRINSAYRSLPILFLCVVLLLKNVQARADEDYVGYRREFYREDDHRMSIDTDSVGWNFGLNSHIRLTGEFVNDAISGASPTGVPQPSLWPVAYPINGALPDFTTLYNQNYASGFAAYTNAYDGSIPYPDFIDYINNTYGSTIKAQATNDANASIANTAATQLAERQGLANAGLLNSLNKVPTTHLMDHRIAYAIGVPITFGIHSITPEYAYSREHDYHSYGFSLNYSVQLNKKNTTLNTGWSHTVDRVKDDVTVWQGKVSDDFIIGITQLLTPKSYMSVNFTYGNEYGYLNDPYRFLMGLVNTQVIDSTFTLDQLALTPESRPRKRQKEIIQTSYVQYFDSLSGSMDLGYRFFHDSYGIFAQTADASWHQKLGKYVVFTPSFRYYYQTAASFYTVFINDISNPPQYASADYRLSELNTYTISGNLTFRVHKHASIDIGYSRYVMQGLDRYTSQTSYPTAHTYTVGGRVWF